jgi:hypothetical protein
MDNIHVNLLKVFAVLFDGFTPWGIVDGGEIAERRGQFAGGQ